MSAVIVVLILTVFGALAFTAGVFVVGLQSGARETRSDLQRARFAAARAERRLHDLTRDAFVSMEEWAERHGQSS